MPPNQAIEEERAEAVLAEERQVGGALGRWSPQFLAASGHFRFKPQDNSMCAHCHHHGATVCRRSRVLTAGRRHGQGRPIGMLTAWLLGGEGISQAEHAALKPTLTERQAAREQLKTDGEGRELLNMERAKGLNESSEPEVIV